MLRCTGSPPGKRGLKAMVRGIPDALMEPFVSLPDGRRERTKSSRTKIINAYMSLVENGEYAPIATRVAEMAGVGLRSVFRHFDDMENLYREANEKLVARVLPIMLEELDGGSWKERLHSIWNRRVRIYALVMPYRIFGSLKRYESPQAFAYQKAFYDIESDTIDAEAPDIVKANRIVIAGLKAILSFDSWRFLREELGLPEEEAAAVVRHSLEITLRTLPDA